MISYILTFAGGVLFGSVVSVATMCCVIVSGKESKEEEKYLNGEEQNEGTQR